MISHSQFIQQLYHFSLIYYKLIGFVSLSTATLFMDVFGQSADALLLTYFTDLEVEKYHFGKEDCGSCPYEIRDIVNHIR